MRGWVAVLALVPAVAWGQGDCLSVRLRESFTEYAMLVQQSRERGVAERRLLEIIPGDDAPEVQAAMYEAVDLLYGPMSVSLSTTVSSMQRACFKEAARQQTPRR